MTKIKICGITNEQDALTAASLGVDFLGFIFFAPSARYIEPARAAEIVKAVRAQAAGKAVKFVGVFVNETAHTVQRIREEATLDVAQLHGDETPNDVLWLQPGAFKAMQPKSLAHAQQLIAQYEDCTAVGESLPQFLVDAYHPTERGGTGHLGDLDLASYFAQRYRTMLAGGLNPDNIGEIVQQVRPWGVDVSSGVELVVDGIAIKGRKDADKLLAFVMNVRRAGIHKPA